MIFTCGLKFMLSPPVHPTFKKKCIAFVYGKYVWPPNGYKSWLGQTCLHN